MIVSAHTPHAKCCLSTANLTCCKQTLGSLCAQRRKLLSLTDLKPTMSCRLILLHLVNSTKAFCVCPLIYVVLLLFYQCLVSAVGGADNIPTLMSAHPRDAFAKHQVPQAVLDVAAGIIAAVAVVDQRRQQQQQQLDHPFDVSKGDFFISFFFCLFLPFFCIDSVQRCLIINSRVSVVLRHF